MRRVFLKRGELAFFFYSNKLRAYYAKCDFIKYHENSIILSAFPSAPYIAGGFLTQLLTVFMRITFYVDRPDASVSTIMANVAFASKRFRISTGVSISPAHWNHDKQEIKQAERNRSAHMKRLNAIEGEIRDAYHAIPFGQNGKAISETALTEFRDRIKAFLDDKPKGSKYADVMGQFDRFIEEHRVSSGNAMVTNLRPCEATLGRYRLVARRIREFVADRKIGLSFDGINVDFYRQFVGWLSVDQNLFDSSVGNHIKILKTFMRWAMQEGLHNNQSYQQFYKPVSLGETMALSAKELRMIRDVDLADSPRLARIRDHFLIQTYTSLRYSDLIKLEHKHFDLANGFIHVPITKTDSRPIIPIIPPLVAVLERYPSLIFEFASNVKANKYLKELGERAGLSSPIVIGHGHGGKRIEETVPRYRELTTHVARRTFVTVSLEFGLQDSIIRFVTGHSTSDVMAKHYAKPSPDVVRDAVCESWRKL